MDLPLNLKRDWAHSENRPKTAIGDFVVMTYNILNKAFCPEGFFQPHCPDELLTTSRRHPLLMKEIDHHKDIDVICMQEVNTRYYDEVLRQDMQKRGFASCYFMRVVNDAVDIDKNTADGSATFYREGRFQLVKEESSQFKYLLEKENFQLPQNATTSLPNLIDSSRVYIFTLLHCLKTKSHVAIGNIHTTFAYFAKMDLATLEIAFAVKRLVEFAGGVGTPHILSGDFNQEPHHPGYQLLRDGSLNQTMTTYLRDYKSGENGKVTSLVDVCPSCFKHNSKNLKSAYEAIVGHEVPFSNYEDSSAYCNIPKKDQLSEAVRALFNGTPSHPMVRKTDPEACGSEKYVGALDYLWYSSDSLHCDAVLKMVDEDLILPLHTCPNAVFPSDHLPIKAKFAFSELE